MTFDLIHKYHLLVILLFCCFQANAKTNIDSCLVAIENFEGKNTSPKYIQLLNLTGKAYFDIEAYPFAISYYSKGLKISESQNIDSLTFSLSVNIGQTYFWKSEYDSSLIYLNNAYSLVQSGNYSMDSSDSLHLFKAYGNTYFFRGHIDKAYEYRIAEMEIALRRKDTVSLADNFYSLAILEKEYGNYENALDKLFSALELYNSANIISKVSFCYGRIGTIYFELGQYEKSLEYLNRSCEIEVPNYQQYREAYCAHNLGKVYTFLDNYNVALPLLQKALAIRENSHQKEEVIQTKLALATLYARNGRCNLAKKKLEECLSSTTISQIDPIRREVYEKSSDLFNQCGNHKLAFHYQNKYFNLRDSINKINSRKELANLNSMHELELQKQQLAALKKEKKITNIYYWVVSMACLLLIGGISLVVLLLRKQYHFNRKLKLQKSRIEIQNNTLFQTNNKLKLVNKELENFAYVASHDLKSPLRTIRNFSSLLEKKIYWNV